MLCLNVRGISFAESLKKYPQQAAAKHQTNKTLEVDQLMISQSQQGDANTFNKIKVAHPGLSSQTNSFCSAATGILNNTAQNVVALNNYQYLLRTSANQNQDVLKGDKLRTFVGPNQAWAMSLNSPVPSTLSSPSVSGSLHIQQQQPSQLHNSTMQSSQSNEQVQEHEFQQLLQEMMNNSRGAPQQVVCTPNVTGNFAAEAFGSGFGCAGGLATRTSAGPVRNGVSLGNNINYASNNVTGMINRTNSSRSIANNSSNVTSNIINPGQAVSQNVCLPELDRDIISQVVNNGEPSDLGTGWKM